MKIVFTTFFKNIGRDNWKSYNRSSDLYVSRFISLAEKIQYDLVVYLDSTLIEELKNKLVNKPNIKFIDIESVNSPYLDYLKNDTQILSSEEYKQIIPEYRKQNPEHSQLGYNAITNCKISFVETTFKRNSDYDFYAWIDFGIVQDTELQNKIVPNNLNLKNIPFGVTYGVQNKPTEVKTFKQMLAENAIYFDGSCFVVYKGILQEFTQMWNNKVNQMHQVNITDDDQNVVLQIYYDNPNIFNLIKCDWFHLFYSLQNNA
tara:strand:+ start:1009 stop:1788 length:780 start_codon:yes stop_codon:yes gene_type:complete